MCDNGGATIPWSNKTIVCTTKTAAKTFVLQINCVPLLGPDGMLALAKFHAHTLTSYIQALFSFLTSSGHLKANNHLSFRNLAVDVPGLITCGEMVFFSILFHFAYPISPYTPTRKQMLASPRYLGGMVGIKALLAAFNILDLLKAISIAPLRLKRGRAMLREEKGNDPGGVPLK